MMNELQAREAVLGWRRTVDTAFQQQQAVLASTALALSPDGAAAGHNAAQSPAEPPALPAPGTIPEQVRDWWNGLRADQKEWLIQNKSFEVGNLDGVPATARERANLLSLERAEKSPDPQVREKARGARAALNNAAQQSHGARVGLYAFDPNAFNGDGKVALSIGDVDAARNVAVHVPGVGYDLTVAHKLAEAAEIYNSANAADPRSNNAVIAWLGYNSPPLSAALNPAFADEGGRLLADDVRGLRAARGEAQPHLTVTGHSYGAPTVGVSASRYGLQADDIVLMAAPGAGEGVTNAAQLGDPKHVWVGSASDDEISRIANYGLNGLGADPAIDTFGANRYQAETDKLPQPPRFDQPHTSSIDKNSESLSNVGKIVAGHPESVTLAAPRQVVDSIIHDPETGTPDNMRDTDPRDGVRVRPR